MEKPEEIYESPKDVMAHLIEENNLCESVKEKAANLYNNENFTFV